MIGLISHILCGLIEVKGRKLLGLFDTVHSQNPNRLVPIKLIFMVGTLPSH